MAAITAGGQTPAVHHRMGLNADQATADRELKEMCEKLLANTVVEDYSVEILS